ncbi:MAG TPA: hypothetical protein VNR65_10525, partial [Geobacterales bacterium]|nr:hypothetical protein [Geobacterales bacterium]
PPDAGHLRHPGGADLHLGKDDRVAAAWMGGVERDGSAVCCGVKMAMLVTLVFPFIILVFTATSVLKGFGTSSIANCCCNEKMSY